MGRRGPGRLQASVSEEVGDDDEVGAVVYHEQVRQIGRTGALLGQVVLGELALSFGLWTAFSLLAAFWMIGAAAGAIWWARGIEARGLSLDALATAPQPS